MREREKEKYDSRTSSGVLAPSDSALLNEHVEIVDCLTSSGAVTLIRAQHMAATRIQAWFRGIRIRDTFNRHRTLLLR